MYLPVELPRDRTRVSLQLQWGFSMGTAAVGNGTHLRLASQAEAP